MGVTEITYKDAIDALFARTGGRIKPGLERTLALLESLNDPHKRFPAFHVAGTNGKGSTCATVDYLLRFKGLRVGRYASPHLVDFRERVLIDGVPISEGDVMELLDQLRPTAEREKATFFEITTALAFAYFASKNVDVAVIETGLGGRFDSTNVINPLVATVTNINFDHTAYLGTTLDQIAYEKAGIFKRGRPAVIGDSSVGMTTQLIQYASKAGVSGLIITRNDWVASSIEVSARGTVFNAETPYGNMQLRTPLAGQYQASNTLTALATIHAAGTRYHLPANQWNEALSAVRLPGRFQRYNEWLFDVAHNPAGAQVLVQAIRAARIPGPIHVLLGVLADKSWEGMIESLAEVADSLIITQPETVPQGRAWDPEGAAAFANRLGLKVTVETDFAAAVALAGEQKGTKVVTGSFHTVGDAMRRLGIDPLKL